MNDLRRILLVVLLLVGGTSLFGQNKAEKDSLFRMLQAERAEQIYEYGINYRRVKGHARFLHNDTYLLCDSASWNVDAHYIDAFGNVQLIQDKTMLKSESMRYWIDESRAVFQGGLVELFDKDGNTLRTDRLTYVTKDSLATFEYGGALKLQDGNVIESKRGTYDGKQGLFSFIDRAELFMDTLEMRTTELRYFTETNKAHFGRNTYVWKDDGFLRADGGWYDRSRQEVYFSDHVFMFNPTYDAWAEELYFDQVTSQATLLHNAQVLDSTNQCIYLGDQISYLPPSDSLSERGLLTGLPAVVYFGETENHEVDTLYARADTILVYAVPRCDISSEEIKDAEKRLEDLTFDALAKKRKEEAEEREKQRIEKMRAAGKLPPEWVEQQQKAQADSLAAVAAQDSLAALAARDSLAAVPDSLAVPDLLAAPDSLAAPADTLAAPKDSTAAVMARDTTPVRHVVAWNNVRMYRTDIQARCDSMVFTEIDSVARLYGDPVLWNEIRNQLSAQEMNLLMKGGEVTRGNMVTDAWVISQQDSIHFNQIKSTEMLGWFRENKLYRFDALGGVTAIFYMTDEEVITTINVKESKSMTASIKDATAQRLLYFESIKSDVYPVGDLPPEKQRLKDFNWRGDERPVSREDITTREIRPSERAEYVDVKRPLFVETNKYFDNYIFELFDRIEMEKEAERLRRQAEQDSLARIEALRQMDLEREAYEAAEKELQPVDSLQDAPLEKRRIFTEEEQEAPANKVDSTLAVTPVVRDTAAIRPEKPAGPVVATPESGPAVASQETVVVSEQLTKAEKRALRRAERKARREARRAARAARRAERQARRSAHSR
ncbi:MAG: hypothetical protein IKS47_06210 [Bacteroidales bacterium]|nr:hypothetical protein [Bacteroidales bacterium]